MAYQAYITAGRIHLQGADKIRLETIDLASDGGGLDIRATGIIHDFNRNARFIEITAV